VEEANLSATCGRAVEDEPTVLYAFIFVDWLAWLVLGVLERADPCGSERFPKRVGFADP
jgi:hypothetical protein